MHKLFYIIIIPLLLFLGLCVNTTQAQQVVLKGSVSDSILNLKIPGALVMATLFKDSVLVNYTRTNPNGSFNLKLEKSDTLLIIFTANGFGDQNILFIPKPQMVEYDLGTVYLPPPTIAIKEIVIKAYADPVFRKGDTLIFMADSFKVRQNATVVDLLKKLPGVNVDKNGKVTVEGKKINKILVDGEEFFGNNPDIALKSLGADAVESVQVYDKELKDAGLAEGTATEKVLDLKLKESAKNGFFGKVEAGTDANKFHEGKALLNRFKGKNKFSVYYRGANTPNGSFDWEDIDQFGLDNERNFTESDDKGFIGGIADNYSDVGFPNLHKGGAYLSVQPHKKLKLSGNYGVSRNQLLTQLTTNTQYLFADSSFWQRSVNNTNSLKQNQDGNILLTFYADSLTEIGYRASVKQNKDYTNNASYDSFLNNENVQFRKTQTAQKDTSTDNSFGNSVSLSRKFKKKDRRFWANVSLNQNSFSALQDFNQVNSLSNFLSTQELKFKREQQNKIQERAASLYYGDRFFKKLSTVTRFEASHKSIDKTFNTFNKDTTGELQYNSTFSNAFQTIRNNAGLTQELSYQITKKISLGGGVTLNSIKVANNDVKNNQLINQSALNVLPIGRISFNTQSNLSYEFSYKQTAQLPSADKVQPVSVGLNQNFLQVGNPNLKQKITDIFRFELYDYKAITELYYGSRISYRRIKNDFASSTFFDTLGRQISSYVNVNGNNSFNISAYFGKPIYKKMIAVYVSQDLGVTNSQNFVNGIANTLNTRNASSSLNLEFNHEIFEGSAGMAFNYSENKSRLNNFKNIPSKNYQYNAMANVFLTERLKIGTSGNYDIYSMRTDGYNVNLFIWNASISYEFLPQNNLIVSFNANDILNNRVDVSRFSSVNSITDQKRSVIARYFLLLVTYNFKDKNSRKAEDEVFVN